MADQTQNGNAFEFAVYSMFESTLNDWLRQSRLGPSIVTPIYDERYQTIKSSFELVDQDTRTSMILAAKAGLKLIFPFEPHLWSGTNSNPIKIKVNTNSGREGDVRDVLFLSHVDNSGNQWEIGTSCKWNHKALKHSRLSRDLDFGYQWLGHRCSQSYWNEIRPIMDELDSLHGSNWRDLQNKSTKFYKPLLDAFIRELLIINNSHSEVPRKLAEYFIGRYDFYKIIGSKSERRTFMQPFNLHNTLNRRFEGTRPLNTITNLRGGMPTSIVDIRFINNSENKIAIILDQGWQFNLRIHNAESQISPSLKFDINFSGNPIASFTEIW